MTETTTQTASFELGDWHDIVAWRTVSPEDVTRCLDAGVDIHSRDSHDATALHHAAWHGNLQAVVVLIKAGANIETIDARGWTPLHTAVQQAGERNTLVVNLFLDAKAKVNVADIYGESPLHEAVTHCEPGDEERVQRLLDAGADINAPDDGGATVLHKATLQAEVMRLLLAAKPNLEARDKSGQTPLHWAASFGEIETVNLLLAAGADIHARDANGKTPLDMAGCELDDDCDARHEVAAVLREAIAARASSADTRGARS